MLPLYEAKMIHHYDHRWATCEPDGSVRDVTVTEQQDPAFVVMPRYWVEEEEVARRLAGRWVEGWLLGWRDIARDTDERTTIAASFTRAGVGNNPPLMLAGQPAKTLLCLQANLSSLVLDYVARLKAGGTHLNFFICEQLAVLPPSTYDAPTPWEPSRSLSSWIGERIAALVRTATDMRHIPTSDPDASLTRWDDDHRAHLRAELDAAFFHLYGVDRVEAAHILDTFPVLRRKEETRFGEYRTRRFVLLAFDLLSSGPGSARAGGGR